MGTAEPGELGVIASKTESRVVNAAGLVQGIVLVTFPAASTIFTDSSDYGLSSGQYGAMFLPQVVTAIAGSLLGSRLAAAIGAKRVYLLGLTMSLVAMGLLLASAPVRRDQAVAYPLLLVATAFLGAGFGLTVPTLNTLTSAFHPAAVDSAVLTLNALLGLGTGWPWPPSGAWSRSGGCCSQSSTAGFPPASSTACSRSSWWDPPC